MARLGTNKDYMSKSASKKAKRASAKGMQDLGEEFSYENSKTAQPEPVAVDVSPVQIPKKLKVVPASSLAPPSLTAQDNQERSLKPPDTVTIPSRSSAPPSSKRLSS